MTTDRTPDPAKLNGLADSIYRDLFASYSARFQQAAAEPEFDQVTFQAIYLATSLRLAAMLAIDTGMDIPRFVAIAAESHLEAYKAAPKFG